MNFKHLIALSLTTLCLTAQAKITVTNAWARATVEGQVMGGAFLVLHNDASTDASLIAASSPIAKESMLHIMSMTNGEMQMSATPEIILPAKQSVELAPKGKHIMFMGLTQTLRAGSHIPLVLTVKQNGKIKKLHVSAVVKALGQ